MLLLHLLRVPGESVTCTSVRWQSATQQPLLHSSPRRPNVCPRHVPEKAALDSNQRRPATPPQDRSVLLTWPPWTACQQNLATPQWSKDVRVTNHEVLKNCKLAAAQVTSTCASAASTAQCSARFPLCRQVRKQLSVKSDWLAGDHGGHLAWLALDFSSAPAPGVILICVPGVSPPVLELLPRSGAVFDRTGTTHNRLNVEYRCEALFVTRVLLLQLKRQSSPPPGDASPHPPTMEASSCRITVCITHTLSCLPLPPFEHGSH